MAKLTPRSKRPPKGPLPNTQEQRQKLVRAIGAVIERVRRCPDPLRWHLADAVNSFLMELEEQRVLPKVDWNFAPPGQKPRIGRLEKTKYEVLHGKGTVLGPDGYSRPVRYVVVANWPAWSTPDDASLSGTITPGDAGDLDRHGQVLTLADGRKMRFSLIQSDGRFSSGQWLFD